MIGLTVLTGGLGGGSAGSLITQGWGGPPAGFDPGAITEVFPPTWQGDRLVLAWSASLGPPAYWYQVYIGGKLAWYGPETRCVITAPAGLTDVQIGVVPFADRTTDFSGSLAPPQGTRARLTWQGGAWEAPDIAGFHIYAGTKPGGALSYASPVGSLAAVEQGLSTDGYDVGGYDDGGYDFQGGTFTWTSQPLASGVWNFAVVPYDTAGNEGTAATTSVTISAPPRPPAANSAGNRLSYSYSPTTHEVTLNWLASPDA